MKKAKVDALIRRKVKEAEISSHWVGLAEGRRLEREQQTLLLTPQEGSILLGQAPEHQYVRVPIPELAHMRRLLDAAHPDPAAMRLRLATFRAVQKCWSTQDGHRVCWFEYQIESVT